MLEEIRNERGRQLRRPYRTKSIAALQKRMQVPIAIAVIERVARFSSLRSIGRLPAS
jgi:hypothetical protein